MLEVTVPNSNSIPLIFTSQPYLINTKLTKQKAPSSHALSIQLKLRRMADRGYE